jgi:RNA polymerase sigma-70 factor (ECF subfamily)
MQAHSADSAVPFAAASRNDGPTPLEAEVTQLFDQFRLPLFRYLSSFGLALQDSEEVVQEVFLALFLHLRNEKPRTNLQGWIFRVAHNLGLRRFQANRRSPASGLEDFTTVDTALNPEQRAASSQRSQRLLSVVRALPEQDRRCLYLRAEGLRYRDIVDVLGMSLGAVAQSLDRSLSKLGEVERNA